MCLRELQTLEDWARLIGTYKKDMGFVGFFESLSIKPDKTKSKTAIFPEQPARISFVDSSQKEGLKNSSDFSAILDDTEV